MLRTTIGVIGNASRAGEEFPQQLWELAHQVGKEVALAGAVLVTGGTGGVMAASSQGAQEGGGLTVGFLPQADLSHANAHLDLAFPTGMGTMRNLLTARTCNSLVMVGGGVGTLNELTIAYDVGTPVVVLRGSGGWSDRLEGALIDGRWLDDRKVLAIEFANSPHAAVELAIARASEPRRIGGLTAVIGSAGA